MQLVCPQGEPRHRPCSPAAPAADADAQRCAQPGGDGGEEAAEREGAEEGGDEGPDHAEEGLQRAAGAGLPGRRRRGLLEHLTGIAV